MTPSSLGENKPEPTPAEGVARYPGRRRQVIGTNIIRLPVFLRPEGQEATDEKPTNVLPFIKKGPRGRKPGSAT